MLCYRTLSGRQASRTDCIAEEDIQTVKLVNQDTGLAKLEEAVVEDMEIERRMQGLRSSNSRGETFLVEPVRDCLLINY